jgi:hypothetical protein
VSDPKRCTCDQCETERIAWLRACLSDGDTLRFHTREELLRMQAELDQLEAEKAGGGG